MPEGHREKSSLEPLPEVGTHVGDGGDGFKRDAPALAFCAEAWSKVSLSDMAIVPSTGKTDAAARAHFPRRHIPPPSADRPIL